MKYYVNLFEGLITCLDTGEYLDWAFPLLHHQLKDMSIAPNGDIIHCDDIFELCGVGEEDGL